MIALVTMALIAIPRVRGMGLTRLLDDDVVFFFFDIDFDLVVVDVADFGHRSLPKATRDYRS